MKLKASPNRPVALATLLLLAMLQGVWAQFDFKTNADNTVTITAYTGDVGGNVVIPASTNGYPVTTIGDQAFSNQPDLTGVTIPNSITNIGNLAFSPCPHLTSIEVDGANPNYASVGGVLFNKAMTVLIQFPGGLTGSYTIPGSVTDVGDSSFASCSGLTKVMIADSVASIGNHAYLFCRNLTNIAVGDANAKYASVGGVLFNKAITTLIQCPGGLTGSYTIPDTVSSVGDSAFLSCSGLTSVTIPNGVTSIGVHAFHSCSGLTNVTIPGGILEISDYAFAYCSGLTRVMIPESVTNIGNYAFQSCSGLTDVAIPNNVTRIGDHSFDSCSGVISVTIPNGVSKLGIAAFGSCTKLLTLTIPGSVTDISDSAFNGCESLQWVTISNGVTGIGDSAFLGCVTLMGVTVPGSVTDIGDHAFDSCSSLTNVAIPKGVTNIGNSAFSQCYSLTNVTIPDGVTSIGSYAFSESSLTSVTVPGSVTNIGSYAFYFSYGLHEAYFEGNAPTVGSADTTIFQGESGAVFYMLGATGWAATFGGWSTAGWYQSQPQILASANGLGVQGDGFHFTISWATNGSVTVESSTDLKNWTPVITNTLTGGTSVFLNPSWTNEPQAFYRLRSP